MLRYTTASDVPYKVLWRGPADLSESWTPQLVNMSFLAQVEWGYANQFLIDMLGDHQQIAGSIIRTIPERHPFYESMYCVGCELVESQGDFADDEDSPGMPSFEYAVYRCTFSHLNFAVLTDAEIESYELARYVERYSKPSGETVQMIGQFEFTSDNSPLLTPPVKHLAYRELTYIWRYVPDPITALEIKFDEMYGRVNNATFDGKYAAETLLMLAPELQRIPSTPGHNVVWDITYRFLYRPQTWNRVYRGAGGEGEDSEGFELVRRRGTSDPPYPSVDFDTLFEVA